MIAFNPETSAFDTAVTRTYGTRLPVIAGGLQWLARAEYVAAAAKAGIVSFITSASFAELDDLKAEIEKCREMCDGRAFGVNVSMLPKLVQGERTEQVFHLIAGSGVKFVETSGRNPEAFMPILKDAGIHVLHKVPSIRYAVKAQDVGVDMVAIVGAECGGHPGMDMIGSMANAGLAGERLDIPWLIGGGIGRGSQLVAALAMGASGVVIGTRFLVCEEIRAHVDYKQKLIDATELDTQLCMTSIRNTTRSLRNVTTETVARIESENPDVSLQELMQHISGAIGRKAYETGDTSRGILAAGHALGFVDKVQPLAEIVDRFETDATLALRRLGLTGC
ncbi:2-nitropropane dioxygenase [Ruegeria sp. ANG-S4]|uniref:NAD(P)H-dependent flavin oxidoreductase n=1 Tax=Ruegeria sp. ANG-S4 TaxID=1577904 RepID=UPI00057F140F|nr:nitronate monooxygenase [Ruegeria sp. ANG-S4]KIC45875.1 2-nitropropane dioxygenase [Ruegeria sp. ANG-S4]